MERRAGRNAYGDAFLLCQQFRCRKSVRVLCLEYFIVQFRVQDFRNKTGADALNLMGACPAFGQYGRVCRFQRNDFHVGILFFQVFAGARHRAAGADARDKDVNLAVGVLPDFGACGGFMDGRVGRVHKLSGDKAVGNFLGQLICFGDSAFHAFRAFRQHNFRAVTLQDVAAFHAHGLRHGQDDAIAFGGSNGRQADARVSGSRLDNNGTFFQQSLCFRILNHRLGDTVLHAACRIEVFQLDQNRCFQSQFLFNVDNFHQRCVADQS